MKWMKGIIIMIIIIVTVLIGILLWMFFQTKQTNSSTNEIQTSVGEQQVEPIKLKRVTNRNIYYTVANSIDKYLDYIVKKDTEAVFTTLSPSYIQEKNITKEDVLQYVDKVTVKQILNVQEMYEQEIDENNFTFYVYGTIQNMPQQEEETKENDFYIVVNVDYIKESFNVIPFKKFPENIDNGGN